MKLEGAQSPEPAGGGGSSSSSSSNQSFAIRAGKDVLLFLVFVGVAQFRRVAPHYASMLALVSMLILLVNVYLSAFATDAPSSSSSSSSENYPSATERSALVESVPAQSVFDASGNEPVTMNSNSATKAAVQMKKARAPYLDNLKAMLTVLVILHHSSAFYTRAGMVEFGHNLHWFYVIAMSLQMIDGGFFMSLFFFISGYFTPSAYRSKGPSVFLRDRFRRLGLPVAVYVLVLNTLVPYLQLKVAHPNTPFRYEPAVTLAWLPLWLLIFNVAYAFREGHPPSLAGAPVDLPSAWKLCFTGLAVGVVWWWMGCKQVPPVGFRLVGDQFLGMPMDVPASLPFYLLSFFGGCIARDNAWLQKMPEMTSSTRVLNAVSGLTIGLTIGYVLYVYLHHGDDYIMPVSDAVPKNQTLAYLLEDRYAWRVSLVEKTVFGMFTFSMSWSCIEAARAWLDFSNSFTRWAAENMYGAYLLQQLVLMWVAFSYAGILRLAGVHADFFLQAQPFAALKTVHPISGTQAVLGFLYVSALSVPLCFILSDLLRRIPGVKQVL